MNPLADKSTLNARMEDYLEAVAMIKRQKGEVGVKDISVALKVTSPTVNSALSKLKNLGYVIHERYGAVDLTPKGERRARDVIQRHKTLHTFLVDILGVDRALADEEACLMEHSISPSTKEKLMKFVESYQKNIGREEVK